VIRRGQFIRQVTATEIYELVTFISPLIEMKMKAIRCISVYRKSYAM